MRLLVASTMGAGHLAPLLPFARAAAARGHAVTVAGPPSIAGSVAAAGHPFWALDDPPPDELGAVWSQVPSLPPDQQNVVVVRDIFARLGARARLPRLREACEELRPDVVLRESAELGSAVAAELAGIPHARVATSLAAMEEAVLRLAAGPVDDLRASAGLPPGRAAAMLAAAPVLTFFPASLEEPGAPGPDGTSRHRDPAWEASPTAGAGDAPLVYVTFGSVAGAMPMAAGVYAAAMEAVAGLPVEVLLTVGREADLDAFAAAPPNVRVERWVPQAEVLGRASAVVCHGGSGSMLGALAAGRPQVVVPLFADQPANAERVVAVGAGLAAPPEAAAIRAALLRVLDEEAFAAAARRAAAEMGAQRPVDDAVALLERLPD